MLELAVNVNVVDILTVRQEQQLGQVIEDHANAVVVETIRKKRQKCVTKIGTVTVQKL